MKKRNVLLLVILLAIGFAAVSTSLILNGTIGIGTKNDDFDVIFVDASLDGEKLDSLISADKKSVTFTSKRLRELNESTRLNYKVKNNSTQYGANVTINCNTYGNENIEITGKFASLDIPLTSGVEMSAQEIKEGYLNAEVIKVYNDEDTSISIECKIVATATSKDTTTDFVPYKVYKDDVLNGADPVLTSSSKTRSANNKELIPVTLANDGTVTYANTEDKWYDYANKEWANAVILIDNTSKKYKVNDVIKEDDIESYFVWIPRYKYQIFNEGNYTSAIEGKPTNTSIAQEIQIEFEGKDITPSNGNTKGSWLTHPAFTNFDVNGLWVGKFETGYEGATTKEEAEINEEDSSKVIIKPNVYSWRYNTVGNMFKTAYNYNRGLDSHMMKNTEWGAVAYLSHSKYGINAEVNINNNSDYLTGYSAAEATNQSSFPGTYGIDASVTLPYYTTIGYKASTTGNITGIYDISGGAHEYVAAYMDGYGVENSTTTKVASGFTEVELARYAAYLDKYANTSTMALYNNRILGDATGEMGSFYNYADGNEKKICHNNWYGDYSHFVDNIGPWFGRGAHFDGGVWAGQFNFGKHTGGVYTDIGSRLVLAP